MAVVQQIFLTILNLRGVAGDEVELAGKEHGATRSEHPAELPEVLGQRVKKIDDVDGQHLPAKSTMCERRPR